MFGEIKLECSVLLIPSLQRVRDDEDMSLSSGGFSVVPKTGFHFWRSVRMDRAHGKKTVVKERRQNTNEKELVDRMVENVGYFHCCSWSIS